MPETPSSPGPGVDAAGRPVIDPTKNVLDLVAAETKRQDDLRDMAHRYTEQIASLRAEHANDLRKAESQRIDAIRAVDVAAVSSAAQVGENRATALAGQVATQADAVRVALAAALEPIQKDIADLRRVQYEAAGGRAQTVDSRAGSANIGMWIGVSIAVASFMLSFAGIAITLLVLR
jgi:hypothetical protein